MNKFIVRNIRQGDWYWVSRTVMKEYASNIGVLPLSIYHFLASMSDEKQSCFPSQSYIAKKLGCSRGSVSKGIKVLRDHNLIAVDKKNAYIRVYYLLSTDCSNDEQDVFSQEIEPVDRTDTNNIRVIKDDTVNDLKSVTTGNTQKTFLESHIPNSKEELLAKDIAETLNDFSHLPLYLHYAHTYPENLLRKILSEVKQKPIHKIKKSRGALSTYLINKHDKGRL